MADREQLIAVTNRVIAAALAVHAQLGPGLLESAYEACLAMSYANGISRLSSNGPLR